MPNAISTAADNLPPQVCLNNNNIIIIKFGEVDSELIVGWFKLYYIPHTETVLLILDNHVSFISSFVDTAKHMSANTSHLHKAVFTSENSTCM